MKPGREERRQAWREQHEAEAAERAAARAADVAARREEREARRLAWLAQHDAEMAERAAAHRAERAAAKEAWLESDANRQTRPPDPEQQALDELVAKRLGIPVEDVPAWRADRQRYMANLGTFEEQMAKAPIAGKDET